MSSALEPRRLADIERQLAQAITYADWKDAALEHDRVSGMADWKLSEASTSYDHADIRARLDELRGLRTSGDDVGLLFALNEGIHGNMGGMGRGALYEKAKFGTKQLIVDYVDELTTCLEYISLLPESAVTRLDKLDFFERASHCFGRTALMLSGAGSLLHFHSGVLETLFEHDLLPTVISGSSGGAVLAGIVGTHSDAELRAFFEAGALTKIADRPFAETDWRYRRPQITAADVHQILNDTIPDLTFQEAFEKTGRMINVTVAPVEEYQASRLMNAITSPNVFIRAAVRASGAVPGVFPPVMLTARNVYGESQPYLPGKRWVDGAVTDDLPAKRLARLYGVNHYIVSQANPLSLLLLKSDDLWPGPRAVKDVWRHAGREWLRGTEQFSRRYLSSLPQLGKALNVFYSLYAQEYTGDINLVPSFSFVDPQKILGHLKAEEIAELMFEGRRSTWPRLEQIRMATQIGRTLDAILDHHAEHDVRRTYKLRAARGGAPPPSTDTDAQAPSR